MKVREIMRREARFCHLWTTLAEAGRIMEEVGCGVLPVVDANKRVIGMLTDRDICLAVAAKDCKPSEVLAREAIGNEEVFACAVDDDVSDALGVMGACQVRRLAVLDEEGRLDGVLSIDDIALVSRALGPTDYTGPFYSDVAKTLKAICGHPILSVC
jgi:CBS domain-containing protein